MGVFIFQPRWKEELFCKGATGEFVLELSMGVLSAYLPTEDSWKEKAPIWARELWPVLRDELAEWCEVNKANFFIDPTTNVLC